jgi:hypothetical protein
MSSDAEYDGDPDVEWPPVVQLHARWRGAPTARADEQIGNMEGDSWPPVVQRHARWRGAAARADEQIGNTTESDDESDAVYTARQHAKARVEWIEMGKVQAEQDWTEQFLAGHKTKCEECIANYIAAYNLRTHDLYNHQDPTAPWVIEAKHSHMYEEHLSIERKCFECPKC